MLNYILASVIAYLGLVAGIIVIYFAKEEQKPGMPYFLLLQNLLVCISVSFLIYFLKLNIFINISLTFLTLLVLFLIKSIKKTYIIYPILGLILFASSQSQAFIAIQCSLVFLIGLSTSALLYDQKKTTQSIAKILLYHLPFLVFALAPLLIKVIA